MKKLERLSLNRLESEVTIISSKEARDYVGGENKQLSNSGATFIKSKEGFGSCVYDDAGHQAIGYGHQVGSNESYSCITASQADSLFKSDVSGAVNNVNSLVHTQLTQAQFDALVSYAYNTGGLQNSPACLAALNAGDFSKACAEMDINTANGSYVQGLENRRESERSLFSNGSY